MGSSKGGGGSSYPTSYTHTVLVGSSGSTVSVDADLDNIRVKELPKLEIGDVNYRLKEMPKIETGDFNFRVKELPRLETGDFNFRVKELPRIDVTADTKSAVNVALTEIPDVRAHLPSHYNVGFALFGIQIWNLSFCGESQVITEKYKPRRMETCK